MKLSLVTLLTAIAGCSASSNGGSPYDAGAPDGREGSDATQPETGVDATQPETGVPAEASADAPVDDATAGDASDASGALTPTWTAFASRGTGSAWGVPVAYDSKDETFVGFSGSTATGTLAGTFSLSMSTGQWTSIPDGTEPTQQYCGCTVYLPDQDQVLIIGGLSSNGPLAAPEAWTLWLATSTWKQVSGTVPDGMIGCMPAYMPSLGKAVIFGGIGYKGASSETWLYDPVAASFTLATPASSPPARADGIAAYDATAKRMLIFAGTNNETAATGHLSDLWAFDGSTWTELQPTGGPPSVRRVPAGGFDAVRRRWVIFGGTDETVDRGDAWLLDVASLTWTQLAPSGEPSPRGFSSSGYDPTTDSYFVVGGLQLPAGTMVSDGWKLQLQ